MVLISACAIGAATYLINQQQQKNGTDKKPPFVMDDDKVCVDLLSFEYDMAFFEPPIATITFFDGNPTIVAKYLKKRIYEEIIKVNPWVGGWLYMSSSSSSSSSSSLKKNNSKTKDTTSSNNKEERNNVDLDEEGSDDDDNDDDKPVVRLWYDKNGKDVAPGLFKEFTVNDIELSYDTPYEEYTDILFSKTIKKGNGDSDDDDADGGGGVIVQSNDKLIGCNTSLWRVSLIPDYKYPNCKFALVVSMSHVGGDAHSYYQLYNMLGGDGKMSSASSSSSTSSSISSTVGVSKLNPIRNKDFANVVKERMGTNEYNYTAELMTNPLWDKIMQKDNRHEKYLFTINKKWLNEQNILYSTKHHNIHDKLSSWLSRARMKVSPTHPPNNTKKKATQQSQQKENCFNVFDSIFHLCGAVSSSSTIRNNDLVDVPIINDEDDNDRKNDVDGRTISSRNTGTVGTYDDTDNNDSDHMSLSTNDVIVSWFWRCAVKPNVGLMFYNFRNRIPSFTDIDMGNYIKPVPYTKNDYKSPKLIRESMQPARRTSAQKEESIGGIDNQKITLFTLLANQKSSLPKFSMDMSISVTTNWTSSQNKNNTLHLPSVTKQIIHLPLISLKHFDKIPKRLSLLLLWDTGQAEEEEEIGALVLGPKSVMDCIDNSNIIGTMIARF